MNRPGIFFSFLLIELILAGYTSAQEADYFLGRHQYSFIAYEKNTFLYPGADSSFKSLFEKFDSLIAFGSGKIQIVHMGGSHIQADIYTHVVRQRMQELSFDMNGGRGLIFPVKMTTSNNPSNFGVRYTGEWKHCTSVDRKKTCRLGITGMSVSTTDSIASISIDPNRDSAVHYSFNQVRIFHEPTSYKLSIIAGDSLVEGLYNTLFGYSDFRLNDLYDTLKLIIRKQDKPDIFTLYGISLDTDAPGLVYHAVGVNGAMLGSYLACELYASHLQTLSPDLVIFSIGTNDGYTREFDVEKYRTEYCRLIEITKEVVPDAAIMLTVPNDSYLYRRYTNQNTEKIRDVIIDLGKKYNCAVWDFFSIMGGLNSCQSWHIVGLMRHDKIHFNRAGYTLKGELFFSAFLKAWENQIENFEIMSGINKYPATKTNLYIR